jgi:hypothetical protein
MPRKGVVEDIKKRTQVDKEVVQEIEERLMGLKARAEELDSTLGHTTTIRSKKPIHPEVQAAQAQLAAEYPAKLYDQAVSNSKKKVLGGNETHIPTYKIPGKTLSDFAEFMSPITFGAPSYGNERQLRDIFPERKKALGKLENVHARAPQIEETFQDINSPALGPRDMPHKGDNDAIQSGNYLVNLQSEVKRRKSSFKKLSDDFGLQKQVPDDAAIRPHMNPDENGSETFVPPSAKYILPGGDSKNIGAPRPKRKTFTNEYPDPNRPGHMIKEDVEYEDYVPGYQAKDYLLDRDELGSAARTQRRSNFRDAYDKIKSKRDKFLNNESTASPGKQMPGEAISFPYLENFGFQAARTKIAPTTQGELEAQGQLNSVINSQSAGRQRQQMHQMKQPEIDQLNQDYKYGIKKPSFSRPNMPGDFLKRPENEDLDLPESRNYKNVFKAQQEQENETYRLEKEANTREIKRLEDEQKNRKPRAVGGQYVNFPDAIVGEKELGPLPTKANEIAALQQQGQYNPKGPTAHTLRTARSSLDNERKINTDRWAQEDKIRKRMNVPPDEAWKAGASPDPDREGQYTTIPATQEPDYDPTLTFESEDPEHAAGHTRKYKRSQQHQLQRLAAQQAAGGPQPPPQPPPPHGNLPPNQQAAFNQAGQNMQGYINRGQQRLNNIQAQRFANANGPAAPLPGGPNGMGVNPQVAAQMAGGPQVRNHAAAFGFAGAAPPNMAGMHNIGNQPGYGGGNNPFVPNPGMYPNPPGAAARGGRGGGGAGYPGGGAPAGAPALGVAGAGGGGGPNMPYVNKYGGKNTPQQIFQGGKYSPEGEDGWGGGQKSIGENLAGFGKGLKKIVDPIGGIVDTVGKGVDIVKDVFGINESREKARRMEEDARYDARLREAEALRQRQREESEEERERRIKQEKYDAEQTNKKVIADQYRAAQASQYGQQNAFGNVHWEGSIEGGDRRLVSQLDELQQAKKDRAKEMVGEISAKDAYGKMATDVKDSIISNYERNSADRLAKEEESLRKNLLRRGLTESSPGWRKAMAGLKDAQRKERLDIEDHAVEQGHKYGEQAFNQKMKVYEKMNEFVDPLGIYKDTAEIGTKHIEKSVLPSLEYAGKRADADAENQNEANKLALEVQKVRQDADAREAEMESSHTLQSEKAEYDKEADERRFEHEGQMQGGRFYHESGMQSARLEHETDEQYEDRMLRRQIADEDRRERAQTAMEDRVSREQISQGDLSSQERREFARLKTQADLLDRENYFKLQEGANDRGWRTSERLGKQDYDSSQADVDRGWKSNESNLERMQRAQDLLDERLHQTREREGKQEFEGRESKKERRRLRKTDYYRRLHEKDLQTQHDASTTYNQHQQRALDRDLQNERLNFDASNLQSDRDLRSRIAFNELNYKGEADFRERMLKRDLETQRQRHEENLLYGKNKHELALTEGKQKFLAEENKTIREHEAENADRSFKIQQWLQEQNLRNANVDRNLKLNEAERIRLEDLDLTNNREALDLARKNDQAKDLLKQQTDYRIKIARENAKMNEQLERVKAHIRGQEATEEQKREIERIIATSNAKQSLYSQGMETTKMAFGIVSQISDIYMKNKSLGQAEAASNYGRLLDRFNFLTGSNNRAQQNFLQNIYRPQSTRLYSADQFDRIMGGGGGY